MFWNERGMKSDAIISDVIQVEGAVVFEITSNELVKHGGFQFY
jgi:hypothetical protein